MISARLHQAPMRKTPIRVRNQPPPSSPAPCAHVRIRVGPRPSAARAAQPALRGAAGDGPKGRALANPRLPGSASGADDREWKTWPRKGPRHGQERPRKRPGKGTEKGTDSAWRRHATRLSAAASGREAKQRQAHQETGKPRKIGPGGGGRTGERAGCLGSGRGPTAAAAGRSGRARWTSLVRCNGQIMVK